MTDTRWLFDAREKELRDKCAGRLWGLEIILRRLRVTGNPDDLADAAFLLGSLDHISSYVDLLREEIGDRETESNKLILLFEGYLYGDKAVSEGMVVAAINHFRTKQEIVLNAEWNHG